MKHRAKTIDDLDWVEGYYYNDKYGCDIIHNKYNIPCLVQPDTLQVQCSDGEWRNIDDTEVVDKKQFERAKILLDATIQILHKANQSTELLDVMCVTGNWDNAECDGYCLLDEIVELQESLTPKKKGK